MEVSDLRTLEKIYANIIISNLYFVLILQELVKDTVCWFVIWSYAKIPEDLSFALFCI